MSNVNNLFRTQVRDWVAYDDKIIKASNAIKRVKDKQSELGTGIISFMSNNGLQKKEIKISNCRLKYTTVRKITPLTKKFIKECLEKELSNENIANEILSILYDPKKRMEICLSYYLNDNEKANEIVNSIFNERRYEEKTILKRKIQRTPLVIDNGPISESAQRTIQTSEQTEDEND